MFKILHTYTNTFIDYKVASTKALAEDDFSKLLQTVSELDLYLVTTGSTTYVRSLTAVRVLLQERQSEEFKIRALHPSHLKLVEVTDV